ncbi:flavodoxin domain-containing protein [Bacillus sp. FJAT-29953]|nr:flavodoxin domain-containing protein [Bacillus sp. FJAT-29953]
MKIAIVYASKTGNTEELAYLLWSLFLQKNRDTALFRVDQFPVWELAGFDAVVVGTYTWGNGEIPYEMMEIYRAFETHDVMDIVTGAVGTGDSGYPRFCGAVDEFRDMLYVQTDLAVTLKIEVIPQAKDLERCKKFVDAIVQRINQRIALGS